ncbi:ABC-2 type transport system ATP-binding protein [Desulfonispora thiosulfatigenes DSM 11270]|uniref:ABC-2 type transport system ATP-binding protein n=1 Tax=Desulfonispora thiosulfatigenes DSM 11270 TaxID=656914 RepID=A0A1W1UVG3_DESTI|nr:ABC transporter ATP-binding protein [Desulfonispora thiosulfatigenes]SMB85072.1 ABC-2 type transport system ATP-binding protein [Desulfonispora thiosulfatigenes DSM 11270]
MIEVKNLSKSFEAFKALKDVNLKVKKGSIYGLIGANGSGKTTLIKHLVGVYKQDEGEVIINGKDIYENNEVKSTLGYIADDLYHFPMYSIKDMAHFYKKLYPNWNEDRYKSLLEIFELDAKRRISRLSKGMQKQVAFILTLSIMPDIMILDEPIDGLDPLMRKRVWKLIVEDVAEREISVLISSHNLKELEDICDHVGIMNKGTILLERDLDEMKSDIHKIQVSFKTDNLKDLREQVEILHEEKRGSVSLLIVKGEKEEVIKIFNKYNPIIMDILPLTLEEIFIYELGGAGYEIQNLIF